MRAGKGKSTAERDLMLYKKGKEKDMTYGDILTFGGIALAGVSGVALIAGSIVFGTKRMRLRKKLFDRYGF